MSKSVFRVCAALALLVAVSACQRANPSQPSSPASGSSAVNSAVTSSVTVPRLFAPPPDFPLRNVDQPVTLVIGNALVTRGSGATYTLEVARDTAFASKVYTKSGVPEGTSGQTSLTIDKLDPGGDYYWRARAEGGGTVGPFTTPRKFTIGPLLVIGAPIPVGPLSGAVTSGWPTFSVSNASKSGPAGAIVYRFEIATSLAFTTLVVAGTVAETPNQTSFTPSSGQAAPTQTALFWRATAMDTTNALSGPASAAQSFTVASPTRQSQLAAQQGLTLWPGTQPPGTTGHAVMGPNWQVQSVRSYDGVTFASPTLEELQIFDLLDRGLDPNGAIGWMTANGYRTTAAYYANVSAIGFPYQYMAYIAGQWELVLRVGA